MLKTLPIGSDDFRKIRDNGSYYVDKTLMIKDFIEYHNEVALITRPRRFGKTLNMTMLREFFDITKDSKAIFEGLAVMDTEYAGQINSRPVIYFTLKDCSGSTSETLRFSFSNVMYSEYERYNEIFKGQANEQSGAYKSFKDLHAMLQNRNASWNHLTISLQVLERVVTEFFNMTPIVLIDEYDQPIISSHEYKYHREVKEYLAGFFSLGLKSQTDLHTALLTGIQRVAKESIFSKLNNIQVFTVLDEEYAPYFGLMTNETQTLLEYYGLELNEQVRAQYNGYLFGGIEIYNPWSILCYAKKKELNDYWINTSTNLLIRESLMKADNWFLEQFEELIINGTVKVDIMLEASFLELANRYTLWGLFVNSGYLTVVEKHSKRTMTVRIPNDEVKTEFQDLVASYTKLPNESLNVMLDALMEQDMDKFFKIYQELVLIYTSFFDAKENAYHMLFLGMAVSLGGMYKITSNMEAGHGRSDIVMESKKNIRPHMIIEFKQGEDVQKLKEEALQQIMEKKYYAGLTGKILCIGLAHDKKSCELVYEMIEND